MRSFLYATGLAAGLAVLAACGANTAGTSSLPGVATAGASNRVASQPSVVRACPDSRDPMVAHCLALVRTDTAGKPGVPGYGPSDLQSAYELPSSTQGSGQLIAIVDAYDDPNAESDLAVYRSNFGLPACNSSNGCFAKVNERGQQSNYPPPDSGWAVEESLDVDMASAICPKCHIVLVEGDSGTLTDLGKSVNEAVHLGANVVSNSYINYNGRAPAGSRYYNHPGTIITAGGGDAGYKVGEPAGYPSVIAVGGTTLLQAKGSRGWSETAWGGTGSGCEDRLAKPSWQKDKGCKGRTMDDVAAVADPSTGVAVYDSYPSGGWFEVGGTSVATPVIAGVYALAGNEGSLDAGQSLYTGSASLWDVTSGSNGTCKHKYLCNAGPGYDGPTGNGTPHGVTAF
ncbi:MAG: S8 family serine peptidase [Candidatus Baltobacteraceae bacterium]